MTETELQAAVIDLARVYGFRVAHFRPAKTEKGWRTPVGADGKGFPDLGLVKPGRMIVAELKSAVGRVTPEQREWLNAFESAGISAYVWRPEHWPAAVLAVLRGSTAES